MREYDFYIGWRYILLVFSFVLIIQSNQSMIKEAILVGGIVFYAFVITTLVRDIRNLSLTQVTKTSLNPSLESLITMRTESSPLKKWKNSMFALNTMEKNWLVNLENMVVVLILTNFQNSSLQRWVYFDLFSIKHGPKMCWKCRDCN